jgi:hypothetical protein
MTSTNDALFSFLFLRKNWSTSWIVLSSRKIEFYKESKQQAMSNMVSGSLSTVTIWSHQKLKSLSYKHLKANGGNDSINF